jgi:DNA ligase-1
MIFEYNRGVKFVQLAEYLEKLEKTSSRLEMTRILAELYAQVSPEEGKIVAYLSAGMLGPKYNNPDTGMAEKQALKAVAIAFQAEVEKVTGVFKKEGDLGRAVEVLSESEKSRSGVSVKGVYDKLREMAAVSGGGSQDKKAELLAEIIKELDGRSAKYVTKIVLGKMRTGFSDMTVLDALSWMKTGDKSLREKIERIYNVRADLGEVVRLVCEHGDISKIRVEPEFGTPILVARAERAKSAAEIWERLGVAAAEHKLDGLRIQAHVYKTDGKKEPEIRLFSRGMENVTAMYPDVVDGLRRQVGRNCILDGEMIAVGDNGKYLPFQETVQRKRKYDIMEMLSKVPLKYYTFDVLAVEKKSMLDEPNEDRWKKLTEMVKTGAKISEDVVRLMPRKIVNSEEEIEKFFHEALAEGTEGVVVKKLSGTYQSGSRDFNWIKYKKSYDETGVADTIDAVVMGYDAGQGKRSGFGIGGFLIGVNKGETGRFQTIAKIGTGLTDDEWRELRRRCDLIRLKDKPDEYEVEKQMNCDVWVEPKMVVEIKADEITRSPMHSAGFALRFPRLVSFREMKVEEAATVAEIKRLFDLQKNNQENE